MSEVNNNTPNSALNTEADNTNLDNQNGNAGGNADEITELKAQIQNLTLDNAKLKRANDKLASENGDLNKKYRAKLSDEEKAEETRLENERIRAEKDAEKDELIASLQREKALANAEKGYLAMGWTQDEAKRMATADVDNDFDQRMKIMQEVNERQKKELETSVLKNRPPIQTGNTGVGASGEITQATFNRMGYKERVELANKNPELYKKFVGN